MDAIESFLKKKPLHVRVNEQQIERYAYCVITSNDSHNV